MKSSTLEVLDSWKKLAGRYDPQFLKKWEDYKEKLGSSLLLRFSPTGKKPDYHYESKNIT